MHVYLVVDCRTPGCKTVHALKYLGMKEEIHEGIDVSMPAPFWLKCPTCGLNHDFYLGQVRRFETEEPPPYDYQDKI